MPHGTEEQRCPHEAVQAATGLYGPVVLHPVSDRRGSAVWRAVGPNGTAAVKVGFGDAATVTAREAAVLDRMRLPWYSASHGDADGAYWIVTQWFTGPCTYDAFSPVRHGEVDRKDAHRAAVDLCRAVAGLHERGWVHADLQPDHAIHTTPGVRLIDMSWSWRPGFPQSPRFMGGVPHLLAPELAASIEAGDRPVMPSPPAEVYALAGVLWTCVTGRWPLDYRWAGIRPHAIGAAGLRQVIATGAIPLSSVRPWPELQLVLEDALLAPASERPTAAQLTDLIGCVARP
ncbi:hypothetical protein ACPEIF_22915 [Streptomyces sp. NPDC012600]|uniref:hypothetical protein n=1 Tax=Streptomyces sp. NPDC012600 TaxID=3415005 RepID=UPI003C2C3BBD